MAKPRLFVCTASSARSVMADAVFCAAAAAGDVYEVRSAGLAPRPVPTTTSKVPSATGGKKTWG